jgi:hypothetical protein
VRGLVEAAPLTHMNLNTEIRQGLPLIYIFLFEAVAIPDVSLIVGERQVVFSSSRIRRAEPSWRRSG